MLFPSEACWSVTFFSFFRFLYLGERSSHMNVLVWHLLYNHYVLADRPDSLVCVNMHGCPGIESYPHMNQSRFLETS